MPVTRMGENRNQSSTFWSMVSDIRCCQPFNQLFLGAWGAFDNNVQTRQTKGSSMGLQCNERRFDCKYVGVQSFPSHCRTKKTSHQIRVTRGFDAVTQLTEQNYLWHPGCLWSKRGYGMRQGSPITGDRSSNHLKLGTARAFIQCQSLKCVLCGHALYGRK